MNGLTLRISRAGGNKSKNSIGFTPVNITTYTFGDSDANNKLFKDFADADTTDVQLAIIKKILDQCKDTVDTDVIQFMVFVFLQAYPKHPVKCFITRNVTKNSHLQQPFTDALALQITALIASVPSHYKQYSDVVSKLLMCIENFNAGVAAIRLVEINLATYLKDCLEYCVKILSETKTLSPTEKNEIFILAHICLRLLLHIIQKGNNDNFDKLNPIFGAVRLCIQQLMFDDDVPMDTKSVSGILYLSMHVTEKGPNSWIDILNPSSENESLVTLLEAEASQLCLYSAIVTVVSVERLQMETEDDQPAIVSLLLKIVNIGERSSSESTFILAVTRTLLQISKLLDKITVKTTGLAIVSSLLTFAWSHLDHYMDSVRHLTAQILSIVISYCAKLDKEGDDEALSQLLGELESLSSSRKSYYVSVTCLVNELGAERVLRRWPTIIRDVLYELGTQHVQASATTTLETLLQKYAKVCDTELLHSQWVTAIVSFVEDNTVDSAVLNILEKLLSTAVQLNIELMDYIITYIRESCEESSQEPRDLTSILMLLSVARKCGLSTYLPAINENVEWKGIISYDVLKLAAVDAVDENRYLSFALIVESPKTTEEFTEGDFSFVLYYLKYNINAQAPNFRQLTLSVMKKFVKRLEDSYKVLKRQRGPNSAQHKVEYYLRFLNELREQCFASLLRGANYSRRCVALQVLAWCERMPLDGYNRIWKPDYVAKLLLHFEDSYENNKALAMEVLTGCPTDIVKTSTYSVSMDIKDIFAQASSLKPTDCVSAAYKFDFLRRRLPEYVLQDGHCSAADPVTYSLIVKLLAKLCEELTVCEQSVVLAARNAPMYGVLHCITHLMNTVDPTSISSDTHWASLISDIITTCMAVNAGVAGVVNNSSPEGHLPMDMSGVVVTDDGNSGGVVLDDGRQVTAQMVLLCAWRSVKEVSLLLGLVSSRLTITGEDSPKGTLTSEQLGIIGEHFTSLLAETKHRGAFEQAYVGFTKLLSRLWRCRSPALHALPQAWLAELMRAIASGDKKGSLCATRRSAGLPFMIQALVTTELQVQGNPKCFHNCMSTLLQLARTSTCVESRSHALNILRALFRNSALDESVAPYVGEGLMVALCGFEGDTWAERNSSTLLFSALMVRVFGVARSRDAAEAPCVRNRMTGRVFFLRYPHLYDFMLEKLQEVSASQDAQVLRPSLYPVLLLLARLYPSSLEGTVSNLKLVAFIPHVVSCASSGVMKARELAARAVLPLISPELYVSHVQSMFALLTRDMERNYCHGILLQLIRLLDARPDDLEDEDVDPLYGCVEQTLWILEQAVGNYPCYLIADEYVKVLNFVSWRFPTLLTQETTTNIVSYLDKLVFGCPTPPITSGRDICLSNALYLHYILINKYLIFTCELVYKSLEHDSYDVVLTTLDYLLILHKNMEEEPCPLQEHISAIANRFILPTIKNRDRYKQLMCKIMNSEYIECQQKSLKVLSLQGDTQKLILQAKFKEDIPDDMIIKKLYECSQNEHESLTYVYLVSLLYFVARKMRCYDFNPAIMVEVVRILFEYSSSDNDVRTRAVIVDFIEKNIKHLVNMKTNELKDEERFEIRATMWCILITLLEDDEEVLRQRVAKFVTSAHGERARVLPSACAARLRAYVQRDRDAVAIFILIALLDFKSYVVTDDGNDDCRVFDQNEKYNVFMEETIWTSACADKIKKIYGKGDIRLLDHVAALLDHPDYKDTFNRLCNNNIVVFKQMIKGEQLMRSDVLNPKIELFYNVLYFGHFNYNF